MLENIGYESIIENFFQETRKDVIQVNILQPRLSRYDSYILSLAI